MKSLCKFLAGIAVLICGLMSGFASAADTRYDFSFTTDNGITSSGWFMLNNSWVSSKSWQAVTAGSYSGSLNVGRNSGITSGTFSSLSVYNIPVADAASPYGMRFTVNGISYTALDNKDLGTSEYKYSLAYKPSGGTTTDSEILSHTFASAALVPELVPEIDGGKLPQAALLVAVMLLLFRNRERLSAVAPSFA